MDKQEVAPPTQGVSSEVLAQIDLGPEIEGLKGLHLRMRRFVFEPGSVFGPVHDHVGRPGMVFILEGRITDHRDGVATAYGPGPGWPEDAGTRHWLENTGDERAVEISVDILATG